MSNKFYKVLFTLFLLVVLSMLINMRFDFLERRITRLEKEVKFLNQEVEAYRDNYTALWTTINTHMQK